MARHPFVVVEGLSGSGKSTVGRLLAGRLGGAYVHTPPASLRDVRDSVDESFDAQARYLFYVAGIAQASAQIEETLSVRPVVCDRYLATTHCWHELIGAAVIRDYGPLGLAEPDATILITCDERIRQSRLEARGRSDNDLREARGDRETRLLAAYRQWGMEEVDNSGGVEMAVDQCVALARVSAAACYSG